MKYLLENQESERLVFRRVEITDFDWWMEFCSNKEATRYFDFTENLCPQDFCLVWFDKIVERYKKNSGGHNVLIEKKTGERIGMCGLLIQEVDGVNELEIGYSIHPNYWGKGFASEAAQKCKTFAFQNKLADSLISIIHVENIGSQKVAKNNEMYLDKTTNYKGIKVHIYRVNKYIHQPS